MELKSRKTTIEIDGEAARKLDEQKAKFGFRNNGEYVSQAIKAYKPTKNWRTKVAAKNSDVDTKKCNKKDAKKPVKKSTKKKMAKK